MAASAQGIRGMIEKTGEKDMALAGIFDLAPQEMHGLWLKPRTPGYAAVLGAPLNVSDIGPDGKAEVTLAG